MTGKGKVNLQLRFDGEDPVVQRALSVLDFLPKKKNYAILIALDEFFQKYGLYEMDETAVKNFICNYEYIRGIYQQFQQPLPNADRPLRTPTAATQLKLDSTRKKVVKKNTTVDASAAPILPSSAETRPTKPAPYDVIATDASNAHFEGDPIVNHTQKDRMQSMLNMFNI